MRLLRFLVKVPLRAPPSGGADVALVSLALEAFVPFSSHVVPGFCGRSVPQTPAFQPRVSNGTGEQEAPLSTSKYHSILPSRVLP